MAFVACDGLNLKCPPSAMSILMQLCSFSDFGFEQGSRISRSSEKEDI
jgi:hypothetical protein